MKSESPQTMPDTVKKINYQGGFLKGDSCSRNFESLPVEGGDKLKLQETKVPPYAKRVN